MPKAKNKKWLFRLPTYIGYIYLFMFCLPFILGMLTPSLNKGLYSAFFAITTIPIVYLLGDLIDKTTTIVTNVLGSNYLLTSKLVFSILSLLFWTLSSFILGALIDLVIKLIIQSNKSK